MSQNIINELTTALEDMKSRFESCIEGGNGELDGDREAIAQAEAVLLKAKEHSGITPTSGLVKYQYVTISEHLGADLHTVELTEELLAAHDGDALEAAKEMHGYHEADSIFSVGDARNVAEYILSATKPSTN